MALEEITRDNFDRFTAAGLDFSRASGRFLQSSSWQKILDKEGQTSLVLAYRSVGLNASAQSSAVVSLAVKYALGPWFYWYAPKGPLSAAGQSSQAAGFFKELIGWAHSEKRPVFWRFEPTASLLAELIKDKRLASHLRKVRDIQPAQTLRLDLRLNETELLQAMHPKTRYNIRLAAKKGVIIRPGKDSDFSAIWKLFQATAARDGFKLHDQDHYRHLLAEPEFIKSFVAEYQGQIIAAGLFSFFAGTATYLHGASSDSDRHLMAPYLLQWEMIKQARAAGCQFYDFYGIDEKRWPGVTRFKRGFGGQASCDPGTYEFVFRPGLYRLVNLIKSFKKHF